MSKQKRRFIGRMKIQQERIPTTEKLAKALEQAGAPPQMIDRARSGLYDDYKSEVAAPIYTLVQDATKAGLHDIAERAKRGEFDGQKWEAEEWGKSPEGQEILKQFGMTNNDFTDHL